MSRSEALGDARDICSINPLPLWALASEVAMRTSLTKDEAEERLAVAIVAEVVELLFEFGGYGEAVEHGQART